MIIQLVTLLNPAMLGLVSCSDFFHSISEDIPIREGKEIFCERIPE